MTMQLYRTLLDDRPLTSLEVHKQSLQLCTINQEDHLEAGKLSQESSSLSRQWDRESALTNPQVP